MQPAPPMAELIPLPARSEESLDALLGALKEGHPAAQARLYDRFARDVNRRVWRLAGAGPDHDDLVQEVFVAIFKRVHTVRDGMALPAWIRTITLFTVRTYIRRQSLKRRFFLRGDPSLAVSEAPARRGDPEHAELLGRVRHILEAMDATDRLCFVLRHVEQQGVAEVASALDLSLSTTKRRLRRAEARFKRRVEKNPGLAAWLEERGGPA